MKQPQLRDYIYFPLKKTSRLASVASLGSSPVCQACSEPPNTGPDEKVRAGKKRVVTWMWE